MQNYLKSNQDIGRMWCELFIFDTWHTTRVVHGFSDFFWQIIRREYPRSALSLGLYWRDSTDLVTLRKSPFSTTLVVLDIPPTVKSTDNTKNV